MGIACPDDFPLLGFVSLFAPAVVRGNTIVIVPSETAPLLALDLYQVSLSGVMRVEYPGLRGYQYPGLRGIAMMSPPPHYYDITLLL